MSPPETPPLTLVEERAARRRRQREILSEPPSLAALGIMIVSCVAAGVSGGPVLVVMLCGLGVTLTAVTIVSGGHGMVMFAGGYLLIALGIVVDATAAGVLSWIAVGVISIAFGDALRLAFTRRRGGEVEAAVEWSVALGLGMILVASLAVGVLVVLVNAANDELSWLVVPLSIVLVVIAAVGLGIAVGRSGGESDHRRWTPGRRFSPPPPLVGADPSTTGSPRRTGSP